MSEVNFSQHTSKSGDVDFPKFFTKILGCVRREIQAPLGDVVGGASLLATVASTTEERERFCGVIKAGAKRIEMLISDLLTFGKIASDEAAPSPILIRVDGVVENLRREFEEAFYGIVLKIQAEAEIVLDEIETDFDLLKKAVRNVAMGLFSKSGITAIQVSLRAIPQTDKKDLLIAIGDREMPTSSRSRNLDLIGVDDFYLNYARLLLDRLNGSLVVFDDEPHGVRGYGIKLRGKSKVPSGIGLEGVVGMTTGVGTLNPEKPLQGFRVLLADDSSDNQVLLKYFLTSLGASCESVVDGYQAVERALSKDFDLVLMDLQMPRMDGHEATTELRRRGYLKPVIGLSAHLGHSETAQCAAEGFSDCIERPSSRNALLRHILGQVAGRSHQGAIES